MPGAIYAVPGTNNAMYATYQATVLDEQGDQYDPRYWFTWQRRSRTSRDIGTDWGWGMWPTRSGFCTDPAAGQICLSSLDLTGDDSGEWAPWNTCRGSANLKFIMGRCKDSGGSGVSGATVQGFVTATDTFVRETTADSNGYYEFGTEYAGTNHYLVAYRAGAPDIAGTTVNTLQGTNRDGT